MDYAAPQDLSIASKDTVFGTLFLGVLRCDVFTDAHNTIEPAVLFRGCLRNRTERRPPSFRSAGTTTRSMPFAHCLNWAEDSTRPNGGILQMTGGTKSYVHFRGEHEANFRHRKYRRGVLGGVHRRKA